MSVEQLNALCDELKGYYTSKGISWQFVLLLSDKNKEILTRAFIREKRKGWNLTIKQRKLIEWASKWKWNGDNELLFIICDECGFKIIYGVLGPNKKTIFCPNCNRENDLETKDLRSNTHM